MNVLASFPRVDISHTPTPLEYAPRLSTALGCQVHIKRDDCTGLASGGNKVRKLEYLLADAQQQRADILVTIGGLQSNHARQTAAAAAKFGMQCELVLQEVEGTPKQDYDRSGNVLLDGLFGANIHWLTTQQDCDTYAEQLISTLTQQGKKPYLIPLGGSNVVGGLGYVRCALELLEQIDEQNLVIDQIVLATGSAGTQAGLLAGLIAANSDIKVLGINVSRPGKAQTALVEALLEQLLIYLGLDPALSNGRVFTNGDYYGKSYGAPTDEMIMAIRQCASLEGVLLDPVYSGKAMAGLIDLCQKKVIAPNSHQLFLHTGGSAGLFAYREIF
ncbi:D-cysteine desulfhydrase [Thalassotalea atypica]|uniref:D-cysteine desulfhydrase n=1 Tax=Thalassotalea atypica TaxID=2054316 RepID=UPI002572BF4B|nr:D-cysteine desulfhydrase [Thalassotalea atypica]